MADTAYVFEGTTDDSELVRLRLIEAIFDSGSQGALVATGLRSGMRCLEIGAGAGSIATWMGQAVGADGRVVAVDVSTRFLATARTANVDVHEADIRRIELEPASFDLAHARFVFIHLAEWRPALEATLRLLKPGGRLLLEEPDFSVSRPLAGPTALRTSVGRVNQAIEAMFRARKMDYAFGLALPAVFEATNLELVRVDNHAPIVRGGDPMARMMGMSTRQLQEKYLATGFATADDIENYGAFSADPSCWAIYHGIVRAEARKPGGDGAV